MVDREVVLSRLSKFRDVYGDVSVKVKELDDYVIWVKDV